MTRRKAQNLEGRQAKLAALKAEEARRRRRLVLSLTAVGAVAVVIVGLVVVKLATGQSASAGGSGASSASSASSAVVSAVANVPTSAFDKVGVGAYKSAPQPIPNGRPLTQNGLPRVLYVGAEYCPYCAAERWAMVAAMSRFGTFHGLGETHSSSQDVYPSTATLSFHGSTYDSTYLAFKGYETESNQPQGSSYAPLDTLPAADQKLFQTYDAPPYVPSQSAGAIPFVDLGGRYLISGASYDPGVLQGMSHKQIAKALSDPSSPVAQSVLGTANVITARLCSLTNDKPADVCGSPGVTAAAKVLKGQ